MGLQKRVATLMTFVVFALLSVTVQTASADDVSAVSFLPEIPVVGCRGERAKLYDECGSQVALYEQAMAQAKEEGKTVLVSYGAEWCIWCHVFHDYVSGEYGEFTHTYSDQSDAQRYTATMYENSPGFPRLAAARLSQFVADHFVIVHVENRYSLDGPDVLALSGADDIFWGGLPFIYTVNGDGDFAGEFDSGLTETRRDTEDWFRGYDRDLMLKELHRLWAAAL